jgi:uncharacterized BrkB/YihY/UPF0761 family membrane protein
MSPQTKDIARTLILGFLLIIVLVLLFFTVKNLINLELRRAFDGLALASILFIEIMNLDSRINKK